MLEWVMESNICNAPGYTASELETWKGIPITEEQRAAIIQYDKFHTMNKHKMLPIPTFKLEKSYAE